MNKLSARLYLGCVMWLAFSVLHCGPPGLCEGPIGPETLDPTNSPCTVDCECNNQRYTGYCQKNGVCLSSARTPCDVPGKKQTCVLQQKDEQSGCTKGIQTCQDDNLTDKYWGDCKLEFTPSTNEFKAMCFDGLDNDCDGKPDALDEDCQETCKKGTEAPCFNGKESELNVGLCKAGLRKCQEDNTWGICEGEIRAKEELCNDQDDDCDGQTDEDFTDKGTPCQRGEGACLAKGNMVCAKDGNNTTCDATPNQPTLELCNDKDDDCDGQIDETFADKGERCEIGTGACLRTGTLECKSNGKALECSATPDSPKAELCNDKDDDCDGQVDETFAEKGKTCEVGKGECRNIGTYTCSSDGKSLDCDATPHAPQTELCNNKDDDCDGTIDEPFPTKGDTCEVGTGACKSQGKFVCKPDGYGVVCDATASPSAVETCNGKDDDCDGAVDETFPQLNKSCTVGRGECTKQGLYICQANGSGTTCNASPGTAQAERCNGKDDDCDGAIDETFTNKGNNCTNGIGACRNQGVFVCAADGFKTTCNAIPTSPQTETCNDKDDDCDGFVDETFVGKGTPCTVGQGECLNTGQFVCSPNGAGIVCGVLPKQPQNELCNGKDDDCDGQTDETFVKKGKVCKVGVGTCQKTGTFVCSVDEKSTVCDQQPGTPMVELCNGQDDDCDGSIDETFTNKGQICEVGVGECLNRGVFICKADNSGTVCSVQAKQPTASKCDQLDRDCDGKIDNTSPTCYDWVATSISNLPTTVNAGTRVAVFCNYRNNGKITLSSPQIAFYRKKEAEGPAL